MSLLAARSGRFELPPLYTIAAARVYTERLAGHCVSQGGRPRPRALNPLVAAFKCPGASMPATGATTLTVPKPVGDKGFFKVWVGDAPIPAEP